MYGFLLKILNVDLSHIECRVTELMKHDRSLTLLNGELIDRWVLYSLYHHAKSMQVYVSNNHAHTVIQFE